MDTEVMLQLLKNADLEGDVLRLCRSFPEYQEADDALHHWYVKLRKTLGYQEFCRLEEAVSYYYSWESRAYYVFGLHLRDELKRAMMQEYC